MEVLVGREAPDFSAKAVHVSSVVDGFTMSQFKGKYVVFFFYPLDFTFVCPTELHAFQEKLEEFKSRGCEVVGCSIDSHYSHLAWLNTPKSEGGIEGVTYPIVSDIHKTISRDYGVLFEAAGVAFRGLFLIDKKGFVRHQVINDLPLGRSVDETLRMVDALQYFESNGEVCPANWRTGEKAMTPNREGLSSYFAR